MATNNDRLAAADEQISTLKAKLKQAKAQRQKIEARKKAADAEKERANDTRRKILAGALVLEMMKNDEQVRARFMARLAEYLTRPDERALFGLYALGEEKLDVPEPVKRIVLSKLYEGS